MRTKSIDASLERTISRDRLTKYLVATSHNLDAALTLYEQNMRLSEAMYTPLQILEICLRNSIDQEMAQVFGVDWLTNGRVPFQLNSTKMIVEARKKCAAGCTNSDMVAEIKFAFWVSLIGPGYDATIWRSVVQKAFRAQGGKKRADVHGRLNAIRRFRNRVAHHEPIYHSAHAMHGECLEAIGWMCLNTCAWAAFHSRFTIVTTAP